MTDDSYLTSDSLDVLWRSLEIDIYTLKFAHAMMCTISLNIRNRLFLNSCQVCCCGNARFVCVVFQARIHGRNDNVSRPFFYSILFRARLLQCFTCCLSVKFQISHKIIIKRWLILIVWLQGLEAVSTQECSTRFTKRLFEGVVVVFFCNVSRMTRWYDCVTSQKDDNIVCAAAFLRNRIQQRLWLWFWLRVRVRFRDRSTGIWPQTMGRRQRPVRHEHSTYAHALIRPSY